MFLVDRKMSKRIKRPRGQGNHRYFCSFLFTVQFLVLDTAPVPQGGRGGREVLPEGVGVSGPFPGSRSKTGSDFKRTKRFSGLWDTVRRGFPSTRVDQTPLVVLQVPGTVSRPTD